MEFKAVIRDARKGRNPQTGAEMEIAASDSLSFKSTVKYLVRGCHTKQICGSPIGSFLSRDGHLYYGSASFAGAYGQFSALHLQPLAYVRQRDMRLLIVGGRKAGAVILYDDLAAEIRLPGSYGDA